MPDETRLGGTAFGRGHDNSQRLFNPRFLVSIR